MNKIRLMKSREPEGPGYRLQIIDPGATIQELLDQTNRFIEEQDPPRLWPDGVKQCAGCHLCCHEPLPVTSIDVAQICQALGIGFREAFKYLNVEIDGKVMDITLKRRKGNCIFLTPRGLCRLYVMRPFLCQTYLCCHLPAAVDDLRSQVVNQGMDELVRLAILEQGHGWKLPVVRGSTRRIVLADWPPNNFSGKSRYSDLRLENVLSTALLQVLLV